MFKSVYLTRSKCKVNLSTTKVPWTKFLDEMLNQYNLMYHSVTILPLVVIYFLVPLLPNNIYYLPVGKAFKFTKVKTI